MKKKKTVKTTKSKTATKKKSTLQVYGYTIERDFMIISGGGLLVIVMLAVFVL